MKNYLRLLNFLLVQRNLKGNQSGNWLKRQLASPVSAQGLPFPARTQYFFWVSATWVTQKKRLDCWRHHCTCHQTKPPEMLRADSRINFCRDELSGGFQTQDSWISCFLDASSPFDILCSAKQGRWYRQLSAASCLFNGSLLTVGSYTLSEEAWPQ